MQSLKDAAVALSLANVCFMKIWAQVLPGAYGHYFMKMPPSTAIHAGVVLDVVLLAAVFWVAVTLARRSTWAPARSAMRWGFLLAFLIALNGVRQYAFLTFPLSGRWAFLGETKAGLLLMAVPLVVLLAFRQWRHRLVRAAVACALLLFPFVLVTFSQAAWAMMHTTTGRLPAAFADQQPATPLVVQPGAPRVVWFLFDGMEQRTAFAQRPSTLQLPEFDRLRRQAISASNAYSPGGCTIITLPALITGRPIANTRPAGADELTLTFADDGTTAGWSTQPTLFSRARALGFNAAVVGYYHPYCRVFGGSLTSCSWETDWWHPLGIEDPGVGVGRIMLSLAPTLLQSVPGVWRVQASQPPGADVQLMASTKERQEYISHYQAILQRAKETATDPALGLTFVHWPVPHMPAVYNRATGEFAETGESTYLDNLALADRTLGDVRRAMEAAGTWDQTTLVVTSDHWFDRSDKTDTRVPFLVKMAGQQEPVVYEPVFNTLLLHDLVLAVLRGDISDAQGAVRWLNQRRPQA